MTLACAAGPVSRSEVHALLAHLRILLHQPPPSGPNYPAEAARDHAIAQMCQLPPGDDPFLVELLEESFAVCRRDSKEMGVCEAIIGALRRRDLRIAADVLGRIAMAEPPLGWISWWVVEILGNSNPREFEAILRRPRSAARMARRADWRRSGSSLRGLPHPPKWTRFSATRTTLRGE